MRRDGTAGLAEELLPLAVTLARQASETMMAGLERTRTVETKTSGTDMVTDVDRACERLIVEGIHAARPKDGIIGEEGTDVTGTSGVEWLVDPIDGTTNFFYGHPGFSCSVAARIDGTMSVAVVHDPMHGEVFTAVTGAGAFRNGRPLSTSTETRLSHALIATGFSYEPERRRRQSAVLERVLPDVRDIRRMGAASVDLCSVAGGRVDAYYERGLHPWDHAAGALIATEAGAIVGNLTGSDPDHEFCLAAPPALFEPLRDLLLQAGADRA